MKSFEFVFWSMCILSVCKLQFSHWTIYHGPQYLLSFISLNQGWRWAPRWCYAWMEWCICHNIWRENHISPTVRSANIKRSSWLFSIYYRSPDNPPIPSVGVTYYLSGFGNHRQMHIYVGKFMDYICVFVLPIVNITFITFIFCQWHFWLIFS